jgi:Flp pilus assembly pilin Flp
VSIFAQFPPGKRAHHTGGCDCTPRRTENDVAHLLGRFWKDDQGQDIAEYAVMLAVILVIVVGTVRLVGSNANAAFSSVASALQ